MSKTIKIVERLDLGRNRGLKLELAHPIVVGRQVGHRLKQMIGCAGDGSNLLSCVKLWGPALLREVREDCYMLHYLRCKIRTSAAKNRVLGRY